VTVANFLLVFAAGAAMIAFWVALRFSDFGPTTFQAALIHVCVSMAAGWAVVSVFSALVSVGRAGLMAGVFGLLLPVLVYTFLAAAWLMRVAWDMLGHLRH
jgi:hypothetical protein